MPTRPRRFDIGYLVVLIICLVAVWPFLSRPDLPQATDAELHIFRLAELSRLVRAGVLYPRWAPNFYFGYGYPIFNYYAPLTYYLGLVVDLLPGLNVVDGVKAVFVLGLLTAGLGMYGFVRDNWGRHAGFVAAAAYVYAPYIQYIDPHARGDLAESFSFGLLPLTLWSLDRLRRQVIGRNWLVAVLLTAAIIVTHNLMAMVFFALLLAWALWQLTGRLKLLGLSWTRNRVEQSGAGGIESELDTEAGPGTAPADVKPPVLFLALLIGVGLAAFFWLPVALEHQAVNLGNVIGEGGHFDFRNHFLTLQELFSLSRWLDWGASGSRAARNLGLVQWLIGGVGVVAVLWGKASNRRQAAFFILVLLSLIFLMLPMSTIVWETAPLLPFLQFPWRLLGVAAAMLAILAGVGAAALAAAWPARLSHSRPWLTAALVGLILLFGLPLSQVAPWPPDFGETTVARLTDMELAGRWLGTTSTGDFLPATVDVFGGPTESMIQSLKTGRIPDRVNRASLPDGANVIALPQGPLNFRYHTTYDEAFLLRLFLFAFPGWIATVDGQPVATELGRPEGFLVVPVPAGDHFVEVRFGSTPARTIAVLVSLTSVAVALLIALRLKHGAGHHSSRLSQGRRPLETPLAPSMARDRGGRQADLAVASVVLGLTALHLLLLAPAGWLRRHSTGMIAIPAKHDTLVDFGGQIALIGYDVPSGPLRAGQTVDVTLYWKAEQPLQISYQVFVHLLNEEGALLVQSDKLHPSDFPTRLWPLDKYVRDEHTLLLPPDLPAGDYLVTTGLWVMSEGWRLPLLEPDGAQSGDSAVLGRIRVRAGREG